MPCNRLTMPLMTLLFASALVGCGAKEPAPVILTPPEVLFDECAPPPMPAALMHPASIREYATAATRWAIDLEERLGRCNADKRAIKAFYETLEHPHE